LKGKSIMANLTNKTALVTGASRGIGAAIAKRLAADGAHVAITYTRGAEAAAQVVKEIESVGGKAIAIQADATDAKAVSAAVEKTVKTFGQLDILVNNAGTAIPKPFEEAPLEELDRVIDINLRGVFIATQAALKHLQDGGRIISIGSCVGERMMTPGAGGLRGDEGCGEDLHTGPGARSRGPWHHSQQHPAGSHRYRSKSRCR
jgi:3-oxoacyl-[acyl-carrier protein] reductase